MYREKRFAGYQDRAEGKLSCRFLRKKKKILTEIKTKDIILYHLLSEDFVCLFVCNTSKQKGYNIFTIFYVKNFGGFAGLQDKVYNFVTFSTQREVLIYNNRTQKNMTLCYFPCEEKVRLLVFRIKNI